MRRMVAEALERRGYGPPGPVVVRLGKRAQKAGPLPASRHAGVAAGRADGARIGYPQSPGPAPR